jgi:hypothetical protein
MKARSNPCPVPCEEKESVSRTRFGRLKRTFRNFKRRISKENKKTKIKSGGLMRGQWNQKDLPKIVKKIVDNNLGITDIEIYSNEIRWHCEINYFDLFPKKKGNENPSKRDENE